MIYGGKSWVDLANTAITFLNRLVTALFARLHCLGLYATPAGVSPEANVYDGLIGDLLDHTSRLITDEKERADEDLALVVLYW